MVTCISSCELYKLHLGPCKLRANFNPAPFTYRITPAWWIRVDRGTMLVWGCTHVMDGGPALIQHWFKATVMQH